MTADRLRVLSALVTNCVLVIGLGATAYWLCYENPVAYVQLVSNDGWAEFAAFAAFLIAAIGFLWLAARDSRYRRVGIVGLAAATLFGAGQGIGWGRATPTLEPTLADERAAVRAAPAHRGHVLAGPAILFFAVIIPRLPRASKRLAHFYERFGVPVVPGRVLPLFLLAALIPYLEVVRTLPDSGVLMNLSLGTALAVMAADLLVRSQGGARDGAAMVAVSAAAVVAMVGVAATPLAHRFGRVSLRRDLNDYAAHRFPAEGMYRQAESIFRHLRSHPEVQQDDTVLNQAIVYRRSGREAEAEQVLRNALAVQRERQDAAPEDPEPFRLAGRILLLLDEVWTAQAALETALAIDSRRLKQSVGGPDEWRIRWSLAKSHHALGHRDTAVEEIARAKELAPDEPTRAEISRWLSWEERRAWLVEVDEVERDRIVMTVAVEA